MSQSDGDDPGCHVVVEVEGLRSTAAGVLDRRDSQALQFRLARSGWRGYSAESLRSSLRQRSAHAAEPRKPWRTVSRAAACAAFGLLVLAAIVAPLTFEPSCHGYEQHGGSLTHVYSGLLALALVMSYGRMRHANSPASLWNRRYAVSFSVYAACTLTWRWLVVTCPVDSQAMMILYAALRLLVGFLSYAWCQVCLASISLVRLRWVGQEHVALQATRVLKLAIGFVGGAVLLIGPSRTFDYQPLLIVTYALVCTGASLFCAFQVLVFRGLLQAGQSALQEARRRAQPSKYAMASLLTATVVLLASATTVALTVYTCVKTLRSPFLSSWWWFEQLLLILDFGSDVLMVILCSGSVIKAAEQEQNFKMAGDLVEAARRWEVLTALREAARAVAGPSVSLAALFEGKDPEELLEIAVERFRCISWETLRRHPYLLIGGGPLDGASVGNDFYKLSQPCRLSGCDVFFSHSWHDDPWEKWRSLAEWCTEFTKTHGRTPYIWFDKVCIDQADIQTDLQCLPIFLAGCNYLLVSCGTSYTSRLWCCVELFVFMKMAGGLNHEIHVRQHAEDKASRLEITNLWTAFDVRDCQCFQEDDKRRILQCIESNHGAEGFNEYIRSLAEDLFQVQGTEDDTEAAAGTSESDWYVVPI
eukprot:TRINITY_DN12699_c0_g1_i1.p1 TRINITY_DN12699_c0_g1~~TRINITY_DN12699_c0_g1_i1.p1  ORF type:complete len:645 (+),score=43.23 TRINITY_DN12699_c0_g1_i1:38-1972(+)